MTAFRIVPALIILLALTSTNLIEAEQISEQLEWSSSLCKELGHENVFDTCTILEFCEGLEHRSYYRNRQLRGKNTNRRLPYEKGGGEEDEESMIAGDQQIESEQMDEPERGDFYEYEWQDELEDAKEKEGISERTAEYGWRAPGKSCTSPGPLIRLDRGTRHGLFLKGSGTTEKVNFHAHGLHIAGHGNGDDPLRSVSGNDIIIYNLTIPEYHMGGTFWYHSHHHGGANKQVKGGAFGMLIVNDGDDIGTDDINVLKFLGNEKLMVIDDTNDGRWSANGNIGTEEFTLIETEWYRMRLLLVNTNDNRSGGTVLFPTSCEVRPIAHDGIFRFSIPEREETQEYPMTGASRLDVAIRCYSGGDGGDITINNDVIGTIVTDPIGSMTNASPYTADGMTWRSKRPDYLVDLRSMDIDNSWRIKVGEVDINDIGYYKQEPLCDDNDDDFAYGSIQEWTIRGANTHPLHVHMYPMQIMSGEGCGDHHYEGEYYDTIVTSGASHKQCKVRTRLIDVGGKTVMHCHIFKHEDQGAMGWINVLGGPVQPNKPRVQQCESSLCDEVQPFMTCGGI